MNEKMLIIQNPVSGMKLKHGLQLQTEKTLSEKYDVDVYRTKSKGDAMRKAAERGAYYDIVAASGGDGTVNEVIAGLMKLPKEQRPTLACIPAGTSNLLAETLKMPPLMHEAAKAMLSYSAKPMDIGNIENAFFATTISFGFFTDTTYNTPQPLKNMFGYSAYIMGAIKSLSTLEAYKMKVEINDEVIEDEFILGCISNVLNIGGIIKLDHNVVSVDDGIFEMLFVKKPQNAAEFGELMAALAYKQYDGEIMHLYRANEVKIEIEKAIPWTIDGEYLKDYASVDIKLHHDELKVLRP